MPNLITHYYLAQTIKHNLSGAPLEIISKEPDAYKLGAMGPDYMFALRELNFKERMLPNTMQYLKAYEVFSLSGEQIRETQDTIIYAYILGLMCHYVADFVIHPYVNYFSENHIAKHLPSNQVSSIHTLIESAIDAHICDEKCMIPSNVFPADIVAKAPRKVRKRIAKFYTKAMASIFGIKSKASRYNFAFVATKLFMKLSIDKSGRKKKFFDKLENIFGSGKTLTGLIHPPEGYRRIDYMNTDRLPWLTIRNGTEYSTENVYELLEKVQQVAVSYFHKFIDYVNQESPLEREDFAINYEGIKLY